MLAKAGAISLKGAVYILPYDDDHYEFYQWLVESVVAVRGEAAFVRTDQIETMMDDDYRNVQSAAGKRLPGPGKKAE